MREFGLIGFPLSHSFSKKYFTEKFLREGLADCQYENFPIEDIAALPALLQAHPSLQGFNITIPYKEKVIPFLSVQSAVVQEMGACNCVRIAGGQLTGYNTDVTGFEMSLLPALSPHHQRALILGTGGAAKAVEYVLKKRGIHYRYVSRQGGGNRFSYEDINAAVLADYTLIVNTTPLGMYPATETCPPLPYEAISSRHYLFDLVYNPAVTKFLAEGAARGAVTKNGADMLLIQAEESWKIWNAATM
ncbi:MAG TPA: shikimate dehydrogenase [Chitinophagaceae bacterium]|nr:shikimate dehydrogenase [Chitinophagaceae bacterium]